MRGDDSPIIREDLMKIGIVSRFDLPEALDLAGKVRDHLSVEPVLDPASARELGEEGVPIEDMEVDALVTIGGDGTVLYALRELPGAPVLGVNMGGRGFLADVNPDEAIEAVGELEGGELEVFERERLKVEVSGDHLAEALNEGVIRSSEPSRTLSFRLLIDGEEVEETEGDGIIVATPTGSTAYAMAAGGPIVDPGVMAHVAVPLSTHRPRAMPLVFPRSSDFEVELLEPGRMADVTVDGQVTEETRGGDVVGFTESDNPARFFAWKGKFYDKIREKL